MSSVFIFTLFSTYEFAAWSLLLGQLGTTQYVAGKAMSLASILAENESHGARLVGYLDMYFMRPTQHMDQFGSFI